MNSIHVRNPPYYILFLLCYIGKATKFINFLLYYYFFSYPEKKTKENENEIAAVATTAMSIYTPFI